MVDDKKVDVRKGSLVESVVVVVVVVEVVVS